MANQACRREVRHEGGEVFTVVQQPSDKSALWGELFKDAERKVLRKFLVADCLRFSIRDTFQIQMRTIIQPEEKDLTRPRRKIHGVIFLHAWEGSLTSSWTWMKMVKPIYDEGLNVVLFDMPGWGRSTVNNTVNVPRSWWETYDWQIVDQAMSQLQLEKCHIVGIGESCSTLLRLMQRAPQILSREHYFHNPCWNDEIVFADVLSKLPHGSGPAWEQERSLKLQEALEKLLVQSCTNIWVSYEQQAIGASPESLKHSFKALRTCTRHELLAENVKVMHIDKEDLCAAQIGAMVPLDGNGHPLRFLVPRRQMKKAIGAFFEQGGFETEWIQERIYKPLHHQTSLTVGTIEVPANFVPNWVSCPHEAVETSTMEHKGSTRTLGDARTMSRVDSVMRFAFLGPDEDSRSSLGGSSYLGGSSSLASLSRPGTTATRMSVGSLQGQMAQGLNLSRPGTTATRMSVGTPQSHMAQGLNSSRPGTVASLAREETALFSSRPGTGAGSTVNSYRQAQPRYLQKLESPSGSPSGNQLQETELNKADMDDLNSSIALGSAVSPRPSSSLYEMKGAAGFARSSMPQDPSEARYKILTRTAGVLKAQQELKDEIIGKKDGLPQLGKIIKNKDIQGMEVFSAVVIEQVEAACASFSSYGLDNTQGISDIHRLLEVLDTAVEDGDPNVATPRGTRPLHMAVRCHAWSHYGSRHEPKRSAMDIYRQTPQIKPGTQLTQTITQVVRELLKVKAALEAPNFDGKTPIDVAMAVGKESVLMSNVLLEDHGEDSLVGHFQREMSLRRETEEQHQKALLRKNAAHRKVAKTHKSSPKSSPRLGMLRNKTYLKLAKKLEPLQNQGHAAPPAADQMR